MNGVQSRKGSPPGLDGVNGSPPKASPIAEIPVRPHSLQVQRQSWQIGLPPFGTPPLALANHSLPSGHKLERQKPVLSVARLGSAFLRAFRLLRCHRATRPSDPRTANR